MLATSLSAAGSFQGRNRATYFNKPRSYIQILPIIVATS